MNTNLIGLYGFHKSLCSCALDESSLRANFYSRHSHFIHMVKCAKMMKNSIEFR